MRYDKNYAYFAAHFDWYTFEEGVGYIPTDKAPKEAVEAMERYNSYTFKKLDFSNLDFLDNGIPVEPVEPGKEALVMDVVARFRKYCKSLDKYADELTKEELREFYKLSETYKLKSITWDKYMGSDIDSLTLFFDVSSTESIVGEFEIPNDEKHMIFYSENEIENLLNWIMIVNPQEIVKNETPTLPDITIKIEEKQYTLQDVIKKLGTFL